MANIKSAKKRINTIDRRKTENRIVKSTIATYTKTFKKLVAENNLTEAEKQLKITLTYADSACSKGVIHKNHASRIASRLTNCLDKAKAKSAKTVVVPAKEEKVIAEVVEATPVETTEKKATKKTVAKKVEKAEKPVKKVETTDEVKKPVKKTEKTETAKKQLKK